MQQELFSAHHQITGRLTVERLYGLARARLMAKHKKSFARMQYRFPDWAKSEHACINSHCFNYVPVMLCPHSCPMIVSHFRLGLC